MIPLKGPMLRFSIISLVLAVICGFIGYGIFAIGLGGTPKIAILNGPLIVTDFNEGVIEFELANALETKLEFVERDADIKAVVIRVNSPGGEATSSERLFLRVASVREKKPVVISAQWLLASGGYMMAMGANHIVANPTSNVGSIGVISGVGSPFPPSEFTVGTGPLKALGQSARATLQELELAKESFYALVNSQRGGLITLAKDELLTGGTWLGVRALQLGLVDELGGEVEAIKAAADLAGLRRYRVVQVEEEMERAGGRYAEAVAIAAQHRSDVEALFGRGTAETPPVPDSGSDTQADDASSGPPASQEARDKAALFSDGLSTLSPNLYYLFMP